MHFVSKLLSDSPVFCVCLLWAGSSECESYAFECLSSNCVTSALRAGHSILVVNLGLPTKSAIRSACGSGYVGRRANKNPRPEVLRECMQLTA